MFKKIKALQASIKLKALCNNISKVCDIWRSVGSTLMTLSNNNLEELQHKVRNLLEALVDEAECKIGHEIFSSGKSSLTPDSEKQLKEGKRILSTSKKLLKNKQ